MSETAVREILEQIEELPEQDRLLLDERLAELVEAEWRREAEAARGEANAKGIDQAVIDRAIEDLRYPR